MHVCVLAIRRDSLAYTVAKALSFGGHQVLVWIADPEQDKKSTGKFSEYLASTPRVTISTNDMAALPREFDHLVVRGHPQLLQHGKTLDMLAERSRHLTIITTGDRLQSWRQSLAKQRREIRWYGRWLKKACRVVYKDGFYSVDLYGAFMSRRVIGFDVHSSFLHDEELYEMIHRRDWEVEAQRPILVNFLGSQDPSRRMKALDSVRPFFQGLDGDSPHELPTRSVCWKEFSDAAPSALPPGDFMDVLTRSDFTLCPPGYSLVTHRPMEALLRGSIPVINVDELDLYDIGLVDGVNCIAVDDNHWDAAVEHLRDFNQDKLQEMRRTIRDMREKHLLYDVSSRQMRKRLCIAE
jgi:hypothetical protein